MRETLTSISSLRANDQALATLREKLFLLWGDLEERRSTGKDIQDLNTPRFECCLQEYGIRSQQRRKGPAEQSEGDADSEDSDIERELGWERRWRMFGTTIV